MSVHEVVEKTELSHLEWFLAGMLSNMRSQNTRRRESFTTVDAFVRTFTAVHLYTHA